MMMMAWWGLQTVMILLEHFENQYCSTRLLVFPPLPSTPPSPLPPSLPTPPKQTLGGLSLLRLQDSLRICMGLRLTEMQVERVRSSEAADSVWLSLVLSLAQIPVTVCPILLSVAAPLAARLWPAFLSATNTFFSLSD